MKRYYVVNIWQALIVCVTSAICSAAAVIAASSFMYWAALPTVHLDPEGKCLRVTSSKNGEAFQCQDRDILLREYRIQR